MPVLMERPESKAVAVILPQAASHSGFPVLENPDHKRSAGGRQGRRTWKRPAQWQRGRVDQV